MDTIKTEGLCPCESGFNFVECCGVPDRTAVNAELTASISRNGITSEKPLTPELEAALESADENPNLFPARFHFHEARAFFVKMSPRWYSESVFLDPARIKGKCVIAAELPWMSDLCARISWQPTSFIFHSAFCGSTLMAQALAKVYDNLSLSEPDALGNLLVYIRSQAALQDKYDWFNGVLCLLARRYRPEQGVVIKANDYANPMMVEIQKWRDDIPILFMYTPLEEFLAGCLKAENRRQWIRGRYQSITNIAAQYLNMSDELRLGDEDYAKMGAIYWSYNMALYNKAYKQSATHLRSLDFNRVLKSPLETISSCGQLFGLKQRSDIDPEEQVDQLFGVYSKNSKLKYSPQQRNTDISQLLVEHRAECDAAELLARQLLGDAYPENGLSGPLLA